MEKVQKQATTFFKEFQAFISKGNVVDLAVAVIVGAAFNNIISSLVKRHHQSDLGRPYRQT